MKHPLDGARLKVSRAQEHLDSLKAEIGVYMDEHPYQILETEIEGEIFPQVRITQSAPLRFSAIIGDCVTNARAALDYVMWELVQRYFDPPFDVTDWNDRRVTAFPISLGPSDTGYKGHLNRLDCLTQRKIPAAAINAVKLAQPYESGNLALWWLHSVVNSDKHRMPVLTVSHVPVVTVANFPLGSMPPTPSVHGSTTKGKTVVNRSGEDVQMYYDITLQVTLQDGTVPSEPVDRTLEQIIEAVADIIPKFDKFFI